MAKKNVEDLYPLSPLQQGLLFAENLGGADRFYWNRVRLHLQGPLDVASYRFAWEQVAARHAALRTHFVHDRKGRVLQVVNRQVELPWWEEDLSGLDETTRTARIASYEARDPPALDRLPLMTLAVFKLAPDEYLVIWGYQHIILDGWSEALIWDELWRIYKCAVDGDHPDLGDAAPYARYIAWLASRDRSQAEAFWRQYLADYASPTLVTRPPTTTYEVTEHSGELPAALGHDVRRFAAQHALTVSTVLMGAWALVLSAERGTADVLFGTAIADRPHDLAEADTIVGLMLATVPLRFRTDSRDSVVDWLGQSQSALIEMAAHTVLSLSEMKVAAGLAANEALIDAMCAVDTTGPEEFLDKLPGSLECTDIRHSGLTEFPLSLVFHAKDRIVLRIHAASPHYDVCWPARAERRLLHVLGQICTNPARPVADLEWLTADEQEQLRVLDATTAVDVEAQLTVDRQIAAHCVDGSARTAIVSDDGDFTYGELEYRVAAIAAGLLERGVSARDTVGVFMNRAPDLVASILAIWRVGAVYVPFDPSHPMERIRKSVDDARLTLTITDRQLRETAAALPRPSDVAELMAAGEQFSGSRADPGEIGYVFYTSGTTGRPNGVPIQHASFTNLLASLAREPGIGPDDRMLAITTVAFDISLVELLLPLTVGATLIIAPDDVVADPDRLSDSIDRNAVTIQFATPATWELLVTRGWQGDPKLIALCGGDTLRSDLARQLRVRVGRLWNLYGPTETAVCSTLGPVDSHEKIDVGRPIANTVTRIVDKDGRRLPFGVPGELCIGGVGVSPGYLGKDELTKKRFVELAGAAGMQRYFRTGDLATMHEDGAIAHLGRLDHQIKIRGFRIEPGEIEAAINAHPDVTGCAVVARTSGDGQKQLVAYTASDVGSSELRRHLRDRVPRYMIPQHFIAVEELPLTLNRKVDYARLPELEFLSSAPTGKHPPATPGEKILADIWCELIGVDSVATDDNFLEVGGHSMLTIRAIARVYNETGVELQPQFFVVENLAQIARRIDEQAKSDSPAALRRDA